MRTIEEVLRDLRALAAKQAQGGDVAAERQQLEQELAGLGLDTLPGGRQQPTQAQVEAAVRHVLANTRGGSRFVGEGGDPAVAAHVASGGTVAPDGTLLGGSAGRAVVQSRQAAVDTQRAPLVRVLTDSRKAARGDRAASERVEQATKGLEGGSYLVAEDTIPGYVAARSAAGPVRALTTEHQVEGREARLVVEGDDLLVVEATPEGGTKPSSDMALEQKVDVIHKTAGTTELPDELIEDSLGQAEQLVVGAFARAMGVGIDKGLLNGTGAGEVLGLLRNPDVHATTVGGQLAMDVYTAIVRACNQVAGRFFDNLSVVLHPLVLERFDLALDGNGQFLFPDGLQGKLGTRARVVPDYNLPVAAGGTVPLIVGDLKQLHFFSRKALAVESNQGPGFTEDTTTYRAVERWGALLAKPSALEIVNGVDLTP